MHIVQATIGPCNKNKPGVFDLVGRAKWDAWNQLGSMDQVSHDNTNSPLNSLSTPHNLSHTATFQTATKPNIFAENNRIIIRVPK